MANRNPLKSQRDCLNRASYLLLAWVFLGLGILGAFLPLLPTTVFIILAAWAFAKSSPEREAWLLNHPSFGPPLRNWRKYRAISARAKTMACCLIALSGLFSVWALHEKPLLLAITLVCLAAVVFYIYRLPLLPEKLE
jgi:uncharacterized protein